MRSPWETPVRNDFGLRSMLSTTPKMKSPAPRAMSLTRTSAIDPCSSLRTLLRFWLPSAVSPWLVGERLANAAVPIATVIGIGIALLIGGVVVTESVYAIPGLGRLTVDAVLARDFPTIQGVILLFSVVYVGVNLLVDLSYVFFDPRIRY